MQYNFVLIRTEKGGKYARKILSSVRWLNKNKYPRHEFRTFDMTIGEFMENTRLVHGNTYLRVPNSPNGEIFPAIHTIVHARCANPRTDWTIKLRELENTGYKVVNSVDCIELTSNKLACSLHLQGKVSHPKSWEYKKDMTRNEFLTMIRSIDANLESPDYIIAKPLTSLDQGANVRKVSFTDFGNGEPKVVDIIETRLELDKVPGNKIVIQEYIPYTALHRVIVIGGKALPYTFIDRVEWHKNGDWKVSCCLNKTTMRLNENANPELLELAEKTQKEVGGVINFIDIFEYDVLDDGFNHPVDVEYTNAEINTACSLNIHEKLAKLAGRKDWNIHSRIARQLVKELL